MHEKRTTLWSCRLSIFMLVLIDFISFIWDRIKENWQKLQIKVAKLSKTRCETGKFDPTGTTFNSWTPLKVGKQVFLVLLILQLYGFLISVMTAAMVIILLWKVVVKCDQCNLHPCRNCNHKLLFKTHLCLYKQSKYGH